MGTVYADLQLANSGRQDLMSVTERAVVDTGAHLLCLPERVASQLRLPELERRIVTTADGATHECPYVGPIRVTFRNRFCNTDAIVIGDEVLLGTVPMELMDVLVDPKNRELIANPQTPNTPNYKIR